MKRSALSKRHIGMALVSLGILLSCEPQVSDGGLDNAQGQTPDALSIGDAAVPMRDGVRLFADVYLPQGDGPFPVILIRVPYGKRSEYTFMPALGRFWIEHGYGFVAQDVRGRFGSEGSFAPISKGQEIPDAYDTLEWIASQPWCDGNIGMMGESYYGLTSLAGAWSGHPALKAISPGTITVAREKQPSPSPGRNKPWTAPIRCRRAACGPWTWTTSKRANIKTRQTSISRICR
jgi:hypothetical protein